jgi:hypothetical protein
MEWPRDPNQEGAHRFFARMTNGLAWGLLELPTRARDEDERMISAAYASLFHWGQVGTAANWQRGEWLVARVQAALGRQTEAMRHARACMDLTEAHPEAMEDFDIAFAHEGMARVLALAGDLGAATQHLRRAEEAGRAIQDPEDRAVFFDCLAWGGWQGLTPASS